MQPPSEIAMVRHREASGDIRQDGPGFGWQQPMDEGLDSISTFATLRNALCVQQRVLQMFQELDNTTTQAGHTSLDILVNLLQQNTQSNQK